MSKNKNKSGVSTRGNPGVIQLGQVGSGSSVLLVTDTSFLISGNLKSECVTTTIKYSTLEPLGIVSMVSSISPVPEVFGTEVPDAVAVQDIISDFCGAKFTIF